jgi:hypothetical protein
MDSGLMKPERMVNILRKIELECSSILRIELVCSSRYRELSLNAAQDIEF